MSERIGATYRFGPYEFRTGTRELYKGSLPLKLRPQPFLLLETLVAHPGEVVSREELRGTLWSDETFVDFEHGLNTSVKELRRALRDSASNPRYIETVPRVGYRLIVPVEKTEPGTIAVEPASIPADPVLGHSRPRWSTILIAALLILVVFASFWWRFRRPQPGNVVNAEPTRLAVLPFENLTGDVTQDYLSDGLTEEMIAQLGRLGPEGLSVIARTSVMHYKHTQEQVDQIGRELGVDYVLEGSVRGDGNRIRVSAQLIRVKDQTHSWARQYDREATNLLSLQAEIAQEISDEMQFAFNHRRPASRAALSPQQSQAYDLYLKGLFFWNKRTVDDFRRAIGYFEQAIAKDPNYASSYAGLADCYALIGGYSGEPLPEYMVKARAAALKALELDPNLPEAHTALAVIVQNYDRDWQTAGNEFRRAIALNPSYATGHHWYAEHLGYLGRFDEAFQEMERARQLDPLSLIITTDTATLLLYSRQYDRAIEKCRSAFEMDPGREGCLARPYEASGRFADALAIYEPMRRTSPDDPWLWSQLAYVYGRSGQSVEARRALEKLKRYYRPERTDPSAFVNAYIGLDDKDHAFEWLENAFSQHSNIITMLKVDPVFDPLRDDPRFTNLMRRAGFAQ
jgi:TolB-like protein/DNA-binding winged helix-turn-helix (wHTH) protein/Flp pilus assembly protein TadD